MTRVQKASVGYVHESNWFPAPSPSPFRATGLRSNTPSHTHQPQGPHPLGKVDRFTSTNPSQSEISFSVPPPRAGTLPKSQGQILAQPHKHNYIHLDTNEGADTHPPNSPPPFHTLSPETRVGKAESAPRKPLTPQPRPRDAAPRPRHALRTRTPAEAPSSPSAQARAHTHTLTLRTRARARTHSLTHTSSLRTPQTKDTHPLWTRKPQTTPPQLADPQARASQRPGLAARALYGPRNRSGPGTHASPTAPRSPRRGRTDTPPALTARG